MFKRVLFIGFGVVALYRAVGVAQQPPAAPSEPASPAQQVIVFERRCATCHDNPGPDSRAPSREALRALTAERVYAALTTGSMAANAPGMTDEQKRSMAELVAGKAFGGSPSRAASAMSNRCTAPIKLENPWTQPQWNGGTPDPDKGWRFQPAERGGLTAEQLPKLKLKWAFAIPGSASMAWSQPTVVGGKVYVGSDNGFVYVLDARTGCVHWSFEAQGQVRSPILIADVKGVTGVRYGAFFGDYRGNIYALDAESGKTLWTKRVDEHEGAKITASLVVDPSTGRLYVPVTSWEEIPAPTLTYKCCTFQGSVVAMDAATGRQIWKTYTLPERPKAIGRKNTAGTVLVGPAGGGVWNPPTIDFARKTLYAGTGNVYIVSPNADADDAIMAFNLDTGQKLWWTHMGPADPHPGGCGTGEERRVNCPGYINGRDDDASGSPVLFTRADGRRMVIEGQESGRITAVDPEKRGAVVWVTQAGDELAASNGGFGGAFDGELYYKPLPFSDQTGAMAAIKAENGERVWYTKIPKPTGCPQPESRQTCHSGNWAGATAIPGAVFTGARDGTLRAFSSKDGKIIWEYPTARTYETVNGVPGNGGGIGGPGPTVAGGMLFTGSGYAILSGAPGNVVLAFGLDQ
jgi:polyvinyl alcohol dehydrogenase (cytochrome)